MRFENLSGTTTVAAHLLRATVAGLLLSVSTAALAQTAPPAQQKKAPTATAPAQPSPAPAAAAPAPAQKATAPTGSDATVVARAGDKKLTRDDVRAFVSTMSPADQEALARDPALFSQTLRVLLANQLVLKEALAKKWQDQPTVAAQLERVRENTLVETYLQSVSTVPAEFPSEAELKAAYDANKEALTLPRQFQVAQIFIASPEGADKEVEERAKKKLADVQAKLKAAGADFAAIAKADSDERASAERGGEIGWLAETQMRTEIKSQLLALQKGETSAAIQVAGGWHFVKLLDTKDAGPAAFADVKEALAQRLRAQRVEVSRRAYLAKLLEDSPPTINEIALGDVIELPKTEAAK